MNPTILFPWIAPWRLFSGVAGMLIAMSLLAAGLQHISLDVFRENTQAAAVMPSSEKSDEAKKMLFLTPPDDGP